MTEARYRQLVAMVEKREDLQRAGRMCPAIKLQHGELRELLVWFKREPNGKP